MRVLMRGARGFGEHPPSESARSQGKGLQAFD